MTPSSVLPLLGLLLVGCATSGSPQVQVRSSEGGGDAPTIDFDAIVRSTLAEEPTPGLAVVATRGGRSVFAKAYGDANRETRLPMTLETPMRIGSVTKTFTAVAVMQLVAAGKVKLDDPIASFLDLPARGRSITIRQLLAHRSGLPNYVDLIQKLDGKFDRTTAQIFALIRDVDLEFAPGTRDSYSNTNYFVLGLLIEKVTGESFAQYLLEHLAAHGGPATRLCDTAPARGYDLASDGHFEPEADVPAAAGFASGGMCSTAKELSRWFAALYRGEVVPLGTVRAMTTVAPLPDGSHAEDGFGVSIYDLEGHRRINKSGAIAGFSASSTYVPDADLLVVAIGNTCCDAVSLVDARLTRALMNLPSADMPLTPAEIARLAGRWIRITPLAGRPPAPMSASVTGGHVRFTFDGGFTWHYRHVGRLEFVNELAPGTTLHMEPEGFEVIDATGRHLEYRRLP